jgi:hypothetical protein
MLIGSVGIHHEQLPVLDGSAVEPTDVIVIGIDQAPLVGSEQWWHTDLRPLAEAAVPVKK